MTTSDFEKKISFHMEGILFKKKKYSFIKKIDEDFFGVIGFGSVSHQIRGSLFIHPTVGVYNIKVDKILRHLLNLDGSIYYQPIINTSIGYLTPENTYKEWFINDTNIDVVGLELIEILKIFGLPFVNKYASINALTECVENKRYILSENRDYFLPILYFLSGNKQQGLYYIENQIENSNNPLYYSYYEKYKVL